MLCHRLVKLHSAVFKLLAKQKQQHSPNKSWYPALIKLNEQSHWSIEELHNTWKSFYLINCSVLFTAAAGEYRSVSRACESQYISFLSMTKKNVFQFSYWPAQKLTSLHFLLTFKLENNSNRNEDTIFCYFT